MDTAKLRIITQYFLGNLNGYAFLCCLAWLGGRGNWTIPFGSFSCFFLSSFGDPWHVACLRGAGWLRCLTPCLTSGVLLLLGSPCLPLCRSLLHLISRVSDLFFPVRLSGNLIDAVFDDSQGLPHLIILHVLLIVKFVGEFEQLVDLSLFSIFLLTFCHGPSRFRCRACLFLFIFLLGSFLGVGVQVCSC